MKDITFENFKKNPILLTLFLPIIFTVALTYYVKNLTEKQMQMCERDKTELKKEIKEFKLNEKKTQLEKQELIVLLTIKQTLDSLKK